MPTRSINGSSSSRARLVVGFLGSVAFPVAWVEVGARTTSAGDDVHHQFRTRVRTYVHGSTHSAHVAVLAHVGPLSRGVVRYVSTVLLLGFLHGTLVLTIILVWLFRV